MEILGRLFGSEARVKLIRLFVFNPDIAFDAKTAAEKSKVSLSVAKKECALFAKMGLVHAKSFSKTVRRKKGKKTVEKKVSAHGFMANPSFPHLAALRALVANTKAFAGGDIVKRLGKAGKLKFVAVAGVFTQNPDSRLDILIVGDRLKGGVISGVMKSIEAELGRELLYAWFETDEFRYRLGMYDKLVRDILDYPHQVLFDRIF
ncbi:MAG: hypothetical protein KGH93_00445 [Patescibacteria group bacterium]|nr:hypothetical protein [Patescibacteria group bacterium]MDE1945659.1 hypothetical protein [Patescibacteria group bacterium]